MATKIVMDRTGDTRHTFDIHDRAEVEKAERRFKELTGAGFTAAGRSGPGEQRGIRSFDPTAEETLVYPRLVGGGRRGPRRTSRRYARSPSPFFARLCFRRLHWGWLGL